MSCRRPAIIAAGPHDVAGGPRPALPEFPHTRAGRARPTSLESATTPKFRASSAGLAPPYGIYDDRGALVGPGSPGRRRWNPWGRWNFGRCRRGSPRPTESMTSAGALGAGRAWLAALESVAALEFWASSAGLAPPYGIYDVRGALGGRARLGGGVGIRGGGGILGVVGGARPALPVGIETVLPPRRRTSWGKETPGPVVARGRARVDCAYRGRL